MKSICAVVDCARVVQARGFCPVHYSRLRRHGDVMADVPIIERGLKECSVPTCTAIARSRGWCDTHACRWKRYGDVDADRPIAHKHTDPSPPGHKWCPRCKQDKPLNEFKASKHTITGVTGRCSGCIRDGMLESLYGITSDQYNAMWMAQNGVCATCGKPETATHYRSGKVLNLAVDHDHSCCPGPKSCGECLRGLLCAVCNRTIGLLDDDVSVFINMADYLEIHRARRYFQTNGVDNPGR